MPRRSLACLLLTLSLCGVLALPRGAAAHPVVENALEVVVEPNQVTVVAKIALEEVMVLAVERGESLTRQRFQTLLAEHGAYVLEHLVITADGRPLTGHEVGREIPGENAADDPAALEAPALRFTFEYPLAAPPQQVLVRQSLLHDVAGWSAPCVVRVRPSTDPDFKMALLTGDQAATVNCRWTAAASAAPAEPARTKWSALSLFAGYGVHGVLHILTGYDHLLFVAALVLATSRLWDLVKVVTAFTLAHTLTLTLSVFNVVTLNAHVVEPIIAASIVFVALQNVFWPENSTGWLRLAIAFGFGLFHGLGFAGGLKDAMSEMPGAALVVALIAFSVGVELGHQMVVLPLFAGLQAARSWRTATPRPWVTTYVARLGSCGIALGGIYFLYFSLIV